MSLNGDGMPLVHFMHEGILAEAIH